MKKITFLLSFFALLQLSASAQTYTFEKWLNGKKSATVLTFDDWSPGQGPIGDVDLNARGLVGTFFVTINNVSDWQPIRNVAAAGNEIGNHTRTHPYLSQVSATQLVDEITTSRAFIESQLPGVKVQTFAYPHGDYNDAVIAETQKNHYSARAFIEPVNANQAFPYEFVSTPKDYYTLNTVPVDVNMTPTIFGNWIQQAINTNGLLTFTIHSLNNASVNDTWWDPITETQYQSLLDKLVTFQDQTWITTYGNSVKYHKEVHSAVLGTVSNTADFWTLNLTDTLVNNQIYNQALTINLQKVAGEVYSSISQNGVNIPFSIVGNNLVFNAVPDAGSIVINKTGVAIVLNTPANNAVFTGLSPISLSATPSLIGTTATNVTFTVNGQPIVVSASPYTTSWTPTAYGSYMVTATVNAANGKTSTATATITVNQTPLCADLAWDAATAYAGGTKTSYNNREYTANWWNQNTRPDLNAGSGGVWTDNGSCGTRNTAPTVSLTSPTVLTYTAPATVSIAANAADTDGTIAKVDFYQGNTLLFSDAISPYAYSWTNVPAGKYTIIAKAYDNGNTATFSTAAIITVNGTGGNQAPTVSLTAPANNASYAQPATVTLTAAASDADGTIAKVEFYNGATLLSTKTASPYTYSWTGVTYGTYQITAKATDNAGAVTTSSIVSINITDVAPVVTLTAPANNATFATAPATVTLTATASDADGTISKVEFYRTGNILIGTVTTSPYTYSWTSVAAGTYGITAKAYDNNNVTTTSGTSNITVGTANIAPTVSLTAPANNASYAQPATVTLTATASDADGTIAKVEFYNGATLLASKTASPYTYSWTGVAYGTYQITAKATDNGGAVTTSSIVNINVTNASPVVSLTAPANNAAFTAPATVTLTASASDADGTISKVEFYNGGSTLIATVTASPYTYSWTSVAAGTYVITAKAYDNNNATTTSTASNITVTGTGGTCTAPQYVAGTTYATGSSVQNNGHKYQCTVGGWCSSTSAYYYAPGTGTAWTSAWTDLGNCTSRLAAPETVNAVRIYPNPSNGSFVIETEEASIAVITNTFGSEVANITLVKGTNEVNLSLSSGIYIVNINNQVSKLVIE